MSIFNMYDIVTDQILTGDCIKTIHVQNKMECFNECNKLEACGFASTEVDNQTSTVVCKLYNSSGTSYSSVTTDLQNYTSIEKRELLETSL